MKETGLIALALFVFLGLTGCNSTPKAAVVEEEEINDISMSNSSGVAAITENEWKLIEVRINNRDTGFNRDILVREGYDHFFTLHFDTDTISGTGAPNRYSAPYTPGDNQSIKIMMMRSTMMASFFQPENLTEHDFFTYMQNAFERKIGNNNLELRSKTADGREVNLFFSLAG